MVEPKVQSWVFHDLKNRRRVRSINADLLARPFAQSNSDPSILDPLKINRRDREDLTDQNLKRCKKRCREDQGSRRGKVRTFLSRKNPRTRLPEVSCQRTKFTRIYETPWDNNLSSQFHGIGVVTLNATNMNHA